MSAGTSTGSALNRLLRPVAVTAVFAFVLLLQPWVERPALADEELVVGVPVTPYVAPPVEPGPEPEAGEPARDYPEGDDPVTVGPLTTPDPIDDGITQTGGEEAILELFDFAPPDALSAPDVNVPGVIANANPPDTVHDVGPNHIVQMTNGTGYIVFDKQGNPLPLGNTANQAIRQMGALWPAGDVCSQYDTDPIVVYDHLADRWLIAQVIRDPSAPGGGNFNPPGPALCIAVSQTPDPTGAWFAYTYDTTDLGGVFPDYEKFGVWPDGYYMSSHEGPHGVFVFDRVNMLIGAAAGFMKRTIANVVPSAGRNARILPADLDGPTPPAGTPNFFVRTIDDQQDSAATACPPFPVPVDCIEVYEAVTDWLTPSFAFNLVDVLTPAPFQIMVCNRDGFGGRDCIPQPNTAASLDALSNRPMMQLKYRNFGTHASMVFNQTIDVSGSIPDSLPGIIPADEVAGVRWYELRKSGANWTIYQQGTYAPQPLGATMETQLLHRWMGSIAMDKFGSMVLGYSIVNDDNANPLPPSISYTGRRFDDLLGLMPQIEQSILVGTNLQPQAQDSNNNNVGARWGDYSAMTVDPVDDCTFWYTQHVATDGVNGRATQIASSRFGYCGIDLEIIKTADKSLAYAGEEIFYTITVINNGPEDASGVEVVDTLPAGVTYLNDTDSCVEDPSGTLTCDLGDIANGDSADFVIKVRVDSGLVANDPDGSTTITNVAEVSALQPGGDIDETNNLAELTTFVQEQADLQITKVCKPDEPPHAGETATCTMFIDNLGSSDARNVVLTDAMLSEGLFQITSTSATGVTCAVSTTDPTSSATVECTFPTIAAGDRKEAVVDFTSADGVDVNDVATLASDTPDPNSGNNQDQGSVTFEALADLQLEKAVIDGTGVAGTSLTYQLTVTNLGGPSTAVNVVVADVLPADVSITSVAASAGACNAGVPGNAALPTTCTFDSLAPNASETMTIVVLILPDVPAGTILQNDASVSSETWDLNNANDLATVDTAVGVVADLVVEKADDQDPVVAGTQLKYTVTVTNNGPSSATMVDLIDTLPAEVDLLATEVLEGAGACVQSASDPDVVSCTIGDMLPGDMFTVVITVLVDPSVPDGTVITNTAQVLEDGVLESEVTEDTVVQARADLWIDKTGNFPTGNPSGTILYFLTVHNTGGCSEDDPQVCGTGDGGPSDALNVVVTDSLPSTDKKLPVEFVSEQCTFIAPRTVECSEPVLTVGSSVTFEIQVRAKGSLGLITNTATVETTTAGGADMDPNPGNDSDSLDMVVQGGTGDGGGPGGGRGRGGGPK